jgi:non-specific serine/threonine protein kinase
MALAWLDRENGDVAAALTRLREVIAGERGGLNPTRRAFALGAVAVLAVDWGDHRAAARLFGATMAHPVRTAGAGSLAAWPADDVAAARAALGDAAFAAAWAEGERMSLDEAAAYALTLEPPPSTRAPSGRAATALTPREQEVAGLIADGKTNREIAEALVIAEPTAERHVANIFNKLGVHSRAQVAAWHERRGAGV